MKFNLYVIAKYLREFSNKLKQFVKSISDYFKNCLINIIKSHLVWDLTDPRFALATVVTRLPSLETSLDATGVDFSGEPVVPDGTFESKLLP